MKKIFVVLFILFLSFVSACISYSEKISTDLTNNVFRLHIIANSDSEYDQEIKLILRDNLIKYMNNNSYSFSSVEECKKHIENNIEEINQVIKNVFEENQYNMNFSVKVDKSYFPTKKYDDLHFPPGVYNCLKIEIGDSIGKNWWCVLYPNLCTTDLSIKKSSNEKLQTSINLETYNLISSDTTYKFKLVELYESIKSKTNL